jgi:hypothetical protein
MPEPLKNLVITIVIVFVLIVLWAITIGFTYWDAVSRRKLSGIETMIWMALAVLIPGAGFVVYLLARQLERVDGQGGSAKGTPRWVTLLKRQPQSEQRTGTIAASLFLQTSSTDAARTQPTRAALARPVQIYKLTVIAGSNMGKEHVLAHLPARIGRGMDVSIPLDDDVGVSRLHAEIYEQAGVLRIRDLMSTHGTLVNDNIITDLNLSPGDRIRVGRSTLMVGLVLEGRQ